MNYDEFAFLNQQLAGMLQSGIPLEGALKQLSENMRAGALRSEIQLLGADLAKGVPLREALPRRQLPEFYVQMVLTGAAGNDLPGMLTQLADYYQRRHGLWMRLKALTVYPLVVLVAALAVSGVLAWVVGQLREVWGDLTDMAHVPPQPLWMWLPVLWFGTLLALALVMLALPATRDWLRWRLPGFQESSLAQFAATMRLMLGGGGDLGQAIGLMQRIEGPSRLGAELARWKGRLAEGHGHFAQFAHGSPLLPGMFLWLVGQDGDDLARGFGRAAQVYFDRARYRVEMMLYAALPVMVLILGFVIVAQAVGMMRLVTVTLGCLGGADGES